MFKYLITSFLLYVNCLFAQDSASTHLYPQHDFRAPLDLAPSLAGCFGEIRPNHFHSGLDYRTNQQQGYPVYAAADGYVSRIRVQIGGGGNILYINHPNGYTTVYMHLQRFIPRIADYLKNYQYANQQFDVDFAPLPGSLVVKKGEVIALSGNTGATAGPHLHFEIRDTKTEETINAQLFGLTIPDHTKPVIRAVYLYRLNGLPFSETTAKQFFKVSGAAGNYRLAPGTVISLSGESGFGLTTFDQEVPGGNPIGAYAIELQLDGKTIYRSELERFFFTNSRAVNAHIDYPAYLTQGVTIQKSFVEPGNPLTIYNHLVNNGLVDISDDAIHTLTYLVKDVNGNTSTLEFNVRFTGKKDPTGRSVPTAKTFYYNQDNEYASGDVKLAIPKGNLYSDLGFRYTESAKLPGSFSKVANIHTRLIPIHDSFNLWIRPDSSLAPALFSKAVIVESRGISQGGEPENGYIRASPKYFGSFYIKLDTVPPVIVPLNISEGRSLAGAAKLLLRISDRLSGIKSFSGTIDGKWVLMEYEQKTSTLFYTFDGTIPPGNHVFRLVVTDNKLNEKIYTANFTR